VVKYLIDTNIVSELSRPQPNPNVVRQFQLNFSNMAIASVTWHELLFGCYRLPVSRKRKDTEQYLLETIYPSIPVIEYDEKAAKWHAIERARLSQIGLTPAFADGQIAATASTNGLILTTRNTKDFINFGDLAIENWFESIS
jgi:tRNA(fMet)-specific endonuclease VapC